MFDRLLNTPLVSLFAIAKAWEFPWDLSYFCKGSYTKGPYFRDFTVFVLAALNKIKFRISFQTDLRKDSRQAVQCGFKTFWNYISCSQIRLEILMFSTIVSSLPQLMELVCIGKTNQTGANIGKTNQTGRDKDFVGTWYVKSYLWKHTIPFVRNI